MPSQSDAVTIIGAGLTGPLLAISLVQRGFRVTIYERRPDMRRVQLSAGRSINLAISVRGIHALREAGLWASMRNIIIPMKGRMMHSLSGELTFQPYGKDATEVINSISRADLNAALMNEAEKRGVAIRFSERCLGFDLHPGAARFRNEETGRETSVESSTIIGADGASSAVRVAMLKLSRFNFSQQYLDYGYKELTIEAGPNARHLLESNALHIWPRGSHMLIALPNIDGTFACILFLPFEGAVSFAALDSEANFLRFFRTNFADALPLMLQLRDNFRDNPTGTMVTIKCSPWHVDAKSLLIGDAAHAIVPFFGQGMNCAFEDCTCLLELLDRHGADWPKVFQEFERLRKTNTDAIADLALENFVEMRDRVGDPHFLFKKKVELALEAKYPQLFVPKYAMVTFHRIPYSVALSRGLIQDAMLDELCGSIDRIEDLDWRKAELMIHRQLNPLEQL
ncbi:MAG TPA: NAD(P)/FAD-dependent oxidoreductase [Candidatus Acidoferrales bacterium]|nr:NAD(P)/FAD-dependent oxidoreductase [Candidatus Acidoferrales bacterium]